jgi:hypothetical protein
MFTAKKGEKIKLAGVLLIPCLKKNIISLGQLDEKCCKVLIEKGALHAWDRCHRTCYRPSAGFKEGEVECWHIDDTCIVTKQCHAPFLVKAKYMVTTPLDLVHSDLYGPITRQHCVCDDSSSSSMMPQGTCGSVSYLQWHGHILHQQDQAVRQSMRFGNLCRCCEQTMIESSWRRSSSPTASMKIYDITSPLLTCHRIRFLPKCWVTICHMRDTMVGSWQSASSRHSTASPSLRKSCRD